jgi:hypothetical protein
LLNPFDLLPGLSGALPGLMICDTKYKKIVLELVLVLELDCYSLALATICLW